MRKIRSLLKPLQAYIYNLRLRYKILVLTVSLVVFATSLTGFYSYYTASRLVTNQAYSQSRETVAQAGNFLDEKLRNLVWVSFFLQTDPSFAGVLTEEHKPFINGLSELQSPLASMRIRDKTIHSVVISTPKGDYFETVNIPQRPFRQTDLYQEALRHKGFFWAGTHADQLFRDGRSVITLVFPVTVPPDQKDSYIIVNISADWFQRYLEGVTGDRESALILLDAGGKEVIPWVSTSPGVPLPDMAALRAKLGQPGNDTRELGNGQPLIVNQAPIPVADWRLVLVQPKAALLAGANAIRVAALMVMGFSVVISGMLSFLLANSIARPLDRLRTLMRGVEERNFSSTFKARYDDEIGDLGRAFNRMAGQLDELVTRVEEEQRAKRHAELRALQAQMNPHFLYNTLDSIYWKAQMQDHATVSEMVVALSRLLRLGLNKGAELTTVEREIEHTELYLRLQKRNYEQLFDYVIEVDPACLEYACPKLILQPIAENSLLHGFAQVTRGGLITITARRDGDRIVLTVKDNGTGLPDNLEEVLQGGYALRNVQERLRLHFGPDMGITFANAPEGGAVAQLIIPARTLT